MLRGAFFRSRHGRLLPSFTEMIFRILRPSLALALVFLGLVAGLNAAAARAYKGAIVMDAATGKVLFEDNADVVSPPASMTKLMTLAVVDDAIRSGKIALNTQITVTRADAKVGSMRDSTVVWLKEKEVFTVDELIYAMMIQSANDAAYALAHNVAPSVPEFVALMNAKARELGMTRTVFQTPNGFPVPSHRVSEGDLTSPRDFALLCRYLVTKTDVLRYTSVKTRRFGEGVRTVPSVMNNHNHLLGHVAGVDGLKTGFTNGAGFCLSTTALRNGHRVIVVMMGCEASKSRDLAVTRLLDQGFGAIPIGAPAFSPNLSVPAAGPARNVPVDNTPSAPVAPTSPTRPPADGSPAIHFNVPGH